MILRTMEKELLTQLKEFPVVTVLGPRQAGKPPWLERCYLNSIT